jgi:hypothetical protein
MYSRVKKIGKNIMTVSFTFVLTANSRSSFPGPVVRLDIIFRKVPGLEFSLEWR